MPATCARLKLLAFHQASQTFHFNFQATEHDRSSLTKGVSVKSILTGKIAVIILVSLVMLAVIKMVGGVVDEREQRQKSVVEEISASYSGAERTASPFLVIPYTEEIEVHETDKQGASRVSDTRRVKRSLAIFPDHIEVDGSASVDWKHRGLFRALVYEWRGHETGSISVPATLPYARERPDSRIVEGTPYLVIALSDTRGLVDHPVASFNGHALSFFRGGGGVMPPGVYAGIDPSWIEENKPMPLEVRLAMRGTESFDFVPFGGATRVSLSSSWPHPSFGGAFLPDAKSEQNSPNGFSANWLVDGLASSASSEMDACVTGHNCMPLLEEQAISVRFIEPVNIYSLSNRAIKYAFLFVELIFAAFFLFELIKRLRIHPAQYLLVGFGIALFFMLLISLSEKMPFFFAYGLAACACTLVIAAYLSSILGGVLRGVGFGTGLAVLFAALYVLLQSEDDALVLGSSLLFVLLAGAMFVTRKLDWYALQGKLVQN